MQIHTQITRYKEGNEPSPLGFELTSNRDEKES